jgi:hypothetical protein
MDFFVVPTVRFQRLHVWFVLVLDHDRRVSGLHHRYAWREAA